MAAENGSSSKDRQATGADGRRKAEVTLDLKAEPTPETPEVADSAADPEVAAASTEAPDAESSSWPEGPAVSEAPAPPASPEPGRGSPGIVALVIAGVVGGVVALALGYGLQLAGVLPAPGETAANAARAEAEAVKDTASGLDQRVTSIEAASAQAIADRALLDDLSRQVGVIDALGESLSDRLLHAEAAIAALNEDGGVDSDMQQTLDSLSRRVTRLETMPPPAAQADADTQQTLSSLSERVTRLETMPSSTPSASAPTTAPAATAAAPANGTAAATAATPPAGDPGARAAAIATFQQAAAGSGPFSTALDKLAAFDVAPATIASLKPLAEKGAPSRADLAAAFPKVADAILAADTAGGEDVGVFGRLAAYGRSLVKVRPTGSQSTGDDTGAVVERMRAAVDAGDFADALDARKTLPAAGQTASRAWADAVADRLEIDRLAEAIAAPTDTGNSSG